MYLFMMNEGIRRWTCPPWWERSLRSLVYNTRLASLASPACFATLRFASKIAKHKKKNFSEKNFFGEALDPNSNSSKLLFLGPLYCAMGLRPIAQ